MPRALVPTLSTIVVMGWAVLAAQLSPRSSTKAVIADVAWIAGTWIAGDGGVSSEERWTSPAGGTMLAVSRSVQGDRLVAFEYLRIVEQAGTRLHRAAKRPATSRVHADTSRARARRVRESRARFSEGHPIREAQGRYPRSHGQRRGRRETAVVRLPQAEVDRWIL